MTACQRWRLGRAFYRPAGEPFDPSRACVLPIEEAPAKAFTVAHHYAGTYPAARYRAGLFVKDRFQRDRLVGVAIFAQPVHQAIVPKYFRGLDANAGAALARLVLLDEVAANAESWFVARAFKLLRAERGLDGVLSYSDPMERRNAAGELVKRGHVGTVYQALNACYRGRSRAQVLILSSDGRVVDKRALSKLRNDESGAAYAYQQLRALGAPVRRMLESGASYIARALDEGGFRRVKHPGNHTYTWWIGDRRRRPVWDSMPFPKAAA